MDIKVISEKQNPLLGRKEYLFEVGHEGGPTPKRDDVRKSLAEVLKVPKDRLILEWMRARFGVQRSRGSAHAYDTKELVNKVVRQHILIRNGLKEKPQKGPGGAAAAETPAAKPEAKGETKAESKPKTESKAEAKPEAKPKAEKKE
ncbi:MAG: 30S ribosomal protein S24e [Euryarchaeota archaeon]|nr:30S ribosomal protein S24e [Euryarchaeota archaeon]MDE1837031.1 30S ribosomal protein S24e [Euryarchaeota archaeon]MDE1879881.1 30S ribosomal protein S24e [Euryarchaeota archaeon]MDE2045689.1 30S ribosomal protein S24e [Thermoplasmata archaeon]